MRGGRCKVVGEARHAVHLKMLMHDERLWLILEKILDE